MTSKSANSFIVPFARAIKKRRLELAISQEKLGELAGLDRTYVSGIERCKRNITVETLGRLMPALSLTPTEYLKRVIKEFD